MLRGAIVSFTFLVVCGFASPAAAQYRNTQFGFEAGYLYYGVDDNADAPVQKHGPLVAFRSAFKLTDHWWLSARIGLSFRDEVLPTTSGSAPTVYILHLVPVAGRYYFLTDGIRPFLGLTQSFQFFLNGSRGNVFWGPGGSGGIEFKLQRDVFLGLQTDVFHMFGDGEFPVVGVTAQLNLFL